MEGASGQVLLATPAVTGNCEQQVNLTSVIKYGFILKTGLLQIFVTQGHNQPDLFGLGGCENYLPRLESQELGARTRITEEPARQQIQAVKLGQRYVPFCPNQEFQSAVQFKNTKGEPDKLSMTLNRNLPKCTKPLCHKRCRLSNAVMLERWRMSKDGGDGSGNFCS